MKTWLPAGLGILAVLYYAATVLAYAYDFPYMDDYPVVVDFLNRLPAAHTIGQKMTLLLEQNNFHRLVLVKLLAWANVGLTGSVSFLLLQYVGLAALLATAALLWRSGTEIPASARLVAQPGFFTTEAGASVLLLLFQFQGWNVAFWPIVAVSNVVAPLLALAAFGVAFRPGTVPGQLTGARVTGAVGLGLLALFTNGNGLLVLPLLGLGWGLRGQWRGVGAALVAGVAGYWVYFQHYQNPSGTLLTTLFSVEKITHLLALDTAFLGAALYHPAAARLPILVGSLSVGWVAYLGWLRYDRTNPVLFWLLIFLHLTGLMLALNRLQNDTSIVFASRYRNITALHLATTYLTVADVLGRAGLVRVRRGVVGLATVGSAALCLVSNLTYHSKVVRFRELKQTDNLLWQRYGLVRACAPQYGPAVALSLLTRRGLFRPTAVSLAGLQSRAVAAVSGTVDVSAPTGKLQYALDFCRIDSGFVVVSGWAKVAGQKANFNQTTVGIKTNGNWQYYSTLFHQRLDNHDSANDKDTGFTAIIPATNVPDSLRIVVQSGRVLAQKTFYLPLLISLK